MLKNFWNLTFRWRVEDVSRREFLLESSLILLIELDFMKVRNNEKLKLLENGRCPGTSLNRGILGGEPP